MYKKYLKIYLVILLAIAMQSCSVLGYFQANKRVSGDFVVELKPKDSDPVFDRSVNVIQGIAAFEGGYFTSQTTASTYLILNYLGADGKSQFATRLTMDSHAQDLSLEQITEDSLVLYTSIGEFDKDGASGLLTLSVKLAPKIDGVRDMSKTIVKKDSIHFLGFRNCTPTLSEDKRMIALRSRDSIVFGNKRDVLEGNLDKLSSFDLSIEQLSGAEGEILWFQGITMKGDRIYCLTGNNSLDSQKKIFVYNLNGEVIKKIEIEENEFGNEFGLKLEPEGMTMIGDELFFTLMTKSKVGGNRKYLFKANI
ncbi:MAG: hypothetical protein KAG37_03160 [Flavobacteriales bacterium]|nr:hypothetical protein [Flavobacteriales bacterium]